MSTFTHWILLNYMKMWAFGHFVPVYSLKNIKRKFCPFLLFFVIFVFLGPLELGVSTHQRHVGSLQTWLSALIDPEWTGPRVQCSCQLCKNILQNIWNLNISHQIAEKAGIRSCYSYYRNISLNNFPFPISDGPIWFSLKYLEMREIAITGHVRYIHFIWHLQLQPEIYEAWASSWGPFLSFA